MSESLSTAAQMEAIVPPSVTVEGDDAPVAWFRHFWATSHGYRDNGDGATVQLGIPCRRIEWRYLEDG